MEVINLNWYRIPKNVRENIINNVYCLVCRDEVQVVDYIIEEDEIGLSIKGNCKKCGNKVQRVIEK